MSLFGDGKKEALLAILALLLLAVAQHAPGLFLGQRLGVAGPEGRTAADASGTAAWQEAATNEEILLPAMQQAGRAVASGSLPTWNPWNRLGEPFSVTGAPVHYPPWWLLALPSGARLLDLLACLHAFVACLGMFRFLRATTVSRYVAFLGGAFYGLGWFYVASLGRLPEAAAAAWTPFVLEHTWRVLMSRERARWTPWWALSTSVMFLTGGTTTALLTTGLAGTVFVASLRSIDWEARRASVRHALEAAVLVALCTAPLWLDAWQLHEAVRGGEFAGSRRLQIEGLAAVVAPGALQPLSGNAPAELAMINPGADALELALYPGALVLFALLMGLFRPKHTLRGLIWLAAIGVGVLLTLDGPVAAALLDPLGWALPRPGAGLLLMHVGAIVLACSALESFFNAPVARPFSVPLTVSLAAAAAAILLTGAWLAPEVVLAPILWTLEREVWDFGSGAAFRHLALHLLPVTVTLLTIAALFPLWRRMGILRFKWVLGTIATAELVVTAWWLVPRVPDGPATLEPATALVATLPATNGRLITAGTADMPDETDVAAEGIRVINTDGRRILERTACLLELVDPGMLRRGRHPTVGRLTVPQLVDDPLLALAGVDLAATRGMLTSSDFEVVAATAASREAAPPALPAAPPGPAASGGLDLDPTVLRIARRRDAAAANRARVHFEATRVAGPAEAAERLRSAASEDGHVPLILEPGDAPDDVAFAPRAAAEPVSIDVVVDRPDRVELEVDLADGRGWVMLADAWGPGWRASVDGAPAQILPASLAFRAVPVSEGRHRVVFDHAPWSERFGIPLAVLGLALAAAHRLLTTMRRP